MSEVLDGVKNARKMIRFMEMGFMPSQDNAQQAHDALKEGAQEVGDVDPRLALQTLRSIGAGIAPSDDRCGQATQEVDAVIESLRGVDRDTLRENSRMRGG